MKEEFLWLRRYDIGYGIQHLAHHTEGDYSDI